MWELRVLFNRSAHLHVNLLSQAFCAQPVQGSTVTSAGDGGHQPSYKSTRWQELWAARVGRGGSGI